MDDQGRLINWPSGRKRKKEQGMALAYLIEKFEKGQSYREREVNDLLNQWTTIGDPALLRRELYEAKMLDREKNGSRYWRVEEETDSPTPE